VASIGREKKQMVAIVVCIFYLGWAGSKLQDGRVPSGCVFLPIHNRPFWSSTTQLAFQRGPYEGPESKPMRPDTHGK
jgi:hypothetical protein